MTAPVVNRHFWPLVMLRIASLLIILPLALAWTPVRGGDVAIDEVVVGFDGAYRVGGWTPLAVRLTGTEPLPESVVLETLTHDAEGTVCRRRTALLPLAEDTTSVVRTVFQAGRAGSALTLRVRDAEGTLLAQQRLHADSPLLPAALPKGAMLAVIADGFEEPAVEGSSPAPLPETFHTASLDGPLPEDPVAYAAASAVIVRGNVALSSKQAEALRRWVAGGGHLAIMLGRDTAAYRSSPLADWIPVAVDEPVPLRDVSALENFPRAARVQVAQLGNGLETFPAGAETPLFVRDLYGFGQVTLFAMDLDRPPFSTWPGLPELLGQGLVGDDIAPTARRRISAPGVTDLATQLMRSEQSFPGVERRSVGAALLLLLLLAAIVGPLDYLLVHHVLRRPALTWITLPAIVLVAGWWLHHSAIAANGTTSRSNELHLIDVDSATGTLRGRSIVTLYAAASTRFNLSVSPQAGSDWNVGQERPAAHLGWFAPPETNLGGAYREASGSLFQPEYESSPAAESAEVQGVPLLVWAGRQFLARWQTTTASDLVDSQIVTSGVGRAEGPITHRLPGPLTNVLVAVGDRVFVMQPGSQWYPDEPVLLESAMFVQKDLDSFLTRKTTTRVEREPGEGGEDFVVNESIYDPESTDVANIATMLTFHTAAGGRGYTGLTNSVFASDDFSRQLDAGKAVVLGQIDNSPNDVTITTENSEAFQPVRKTTFVRFVLPTSQARGLVPAALTPLAPTEENPPE